MMEEDLYSTMSLDRQIDNHEISCMDLPGRRYLNHITTHWLTTKFVGKLIRFIMIVEAMDNLRF